jgi:hypothetical protein
LLKEYLIKLKERRELRHQLILLSQEEHLE